MPAFDDGLSDMIPLEKFVPAEQFADESRDS